MKTSLFVAVLGFVAVVFLSVSSAMAGLAREIEINNPGFEAPAYAEGDYGATTGWTLGYYTLPDTTTWEPEEFADNEAHGGFNPSAAEGYGGVAPEGKNVAYTSSFAGYDAGLSQVLSTTLEANSQYELSVLVGNPAPYNGGLTADYRIELLAGDVLLASDTGPSPVDDTTWTTASLSYNSGANPAQLGQPLEIRLLAVDFADWYEVHYDNVTLTRESLVPLPLAYGPEPGQGEMIEAIAQLLRWKPGDLAVSHNVYFGDNLDDVNQATPEDDAFMGNQSETVFLAQGLTPGATYYWRIDEVNDLDPNSPWKGDIWSFHVKPAVAWAPTPADGGQYVLTDPTLTWEPGLDTLFHTVYFGGSFDEVSDATTGGFQIIDATHEPGPLASDTTYYWRVDEFATTGTTHKGDVWSFTTVPEVAVTDPTLVGWWTLDEGVGGTAVDWSGHGDHGTLMGDPQWVDGYHGGALDFDGNDHVDTGNTTDLATWTVAAWVISPAAPSGGAASGPVHREKNYQLDWNHANEVFRGAAALRVGETWHAASFGGLAGNTWYHLAATFDGTALTSYKNGVLIVSNTAAAGTPDAEAGTLLIARHSTSSGNYFTGTVDDVRVYDRALAEDEIKQVMQGNPVLAGNPGPDRGAIVDIRDATVLRWSAGETAVSHDVYFGTDRNAVAAADNDAPEFQGNQPGTSCALAGLVEFGGGEYYWRIDEVEAGGTVHEGNVWKFTVPDYLIVDDFESYDDDIDAGTTVYQTWIDGWTNGTGSTVGYEVSSGGTFGETSIVHGGAQSMPLVYDNVVAPGVSEADRTFSPAQDWTAEGVTTLVVHFRGAVENTGQLYVEINGVKVPYNGDPADIASTGWIAWEIDLASAGVNLTSVTTLTIGVEGGAAGTVYVDDIILIRTQGIPTENRNAQGGCGRRAAALFSYALGA